MKTHPTPPTRSVISLSASLLLISTLPNWAACGPGTPTITNIPSFGGSSSMARALGASGQVTGFSYLTDDTALHAYLYGSGGLTDLGTLGGMGSQGLAVNAAGLVVGESLITDNAETHAFLFNGSAMVDLGTLGGSYSSATAINSAGQVAGHSYTSGDLTQEAFRYSGGSMVGLGTLGGPSSSAVGINAVGNVAGSSYTETFETHAFFHNGSMVDLGSLDGGYSAAFAINDNNQVVGESSLPSGEIHGFVYSGGVMTDLGTLGGTFSIATKINNAGQIIGIAATTNDAERHGFIYSGGVMTDLGTLGGSFSTPYAINELGQVVGESENAEFARRAFLWQNGSMIDLNTLLPGGSGWELSYAQFINNAGRIVGEGLLNGEPRWFVFDLGSGNNNPPTANAGQDQTAQCSGQVTLDGTQSSDPDGDVLTYEWSEGSVVLGNSVTLTATFGAGDHTVTLKVTDPCGDVAQDTVLVQVVGDTTPPTISCPSTVAGGNSGNCETVVPDLRPLVVVSDNCTPANALVVTQSPAPGTVLGSGQHSITVTVTDAAGNSASCSSPLTVGDTTPPVILRTPQCLTVSTGRDCDGEVPSLKGQIVAKDNCTPAKALVVTQSPVAGTQLPKGKHLITVTVTDAAGNSTTKAVELRIEDRTSPKIRSVTATPDALTPADNRRVNVSLAVVATDNCDSAPSSKIVRVLCDERTDDGDIKILGDLSVRLAASRSSRGDGRVYKVIVRCRDNSGNVTYDSVSVRVPKTSGRGRH